MEARRGGKPRRKGGTPGGKVGRPKLELDAVEVGKLAEIGATQDEIAHFFGVSEKTVRRRLKEEPELRAAWETGLARCRISLRRQQLKLAGRNAAMAIFLGKNFLGQRDYQRLEHAGSITAHDSAIADLDLSKLSSDELRAFRAIVAKAKPAEDASADDVEAA